MWYLSSTPTCTIILNTDHDDDPEFTKCTRFIRVYNMHICYTFFNRERNESMIAVKLIYSVMQSYGNSFLTSLSYRDEDSILDQIYERNKKKLDLYYNNLNW